MKVERCGYILAKIKLNKLLDVLDIQSDSEEVILGISDDSRKIKKNWLFIAHSLKRKQFIDEVLEKGAFVVVDEEDHRSCVYSHANFNKFDELIHTFYKDLNEGLCVIGITGTNGKSSATDILTQMLLMHGYKVMRIGTDGIIWGEQIITIANTTPSPFLLAEMLSIAKKENIKYIVMEVSSHAIDQRRISFIQFDMIVYTNITSDHLDYHLTNTHYRYTKFKLRNYLKENGKIFINSDKENLEALYEMSDKQFITYGCEGCHFQVEHLEMNDHETSFYINGYLFHSKLISTANVYNMALTIAVARSLKIEYKNLQSYIEKLTFVKGRNEVVYHKRFTVWLDYAHTENSLAQILKFANQVKQSRVITVIGCGGERDRSKRDKMAFISAKYSDISIFSADNPRSENLTSIFDDMDIISIPAKEVFENRYYAIKHAIKIAHNSDIIIVAGRGNEEYQNINGEQIYFSDRETIRAIIGWEEH